MWINAITVPLYTHDVINCNNDEDIQIATINSVKYRGAVRKLGTVL